MLGMQTHDDLVAIQGNPHTRAAWLWMWLPDEALLVRPGAGFSVLPDHHGSYLFLLPHPWSASLLRCHVLEGPGVTCLGLQRCCDCSG